MLTAQNREDIPTGTPGQNFEALIERAEAYGKVSLELFKLKLLKAVTQTVTTVVSRVVVFTLVILFLLILSIGISLYLGELLGKVYYGFLVVSGVYLLIIAIVAIFLRQWLRNIAARSIIEDMLK